MQTLPPRDAILEQLDRMLASDTFAGAERSRGLLRFLVEHVVEQRTDRLKEYTIGSEALGRGDAFDPRIDPIVRAEASRLRSRLERYYAIDGASDPVLITLPKGAYVLQVQPRTVRDAGASVPAAGGAATASSRSHSFLWFLLGGATVGAVVALFLWTRGSTPPTPAFGDVGIIDFELGADDRSLNADWGNDVVLSPDGTRIVFVARSPDGVLHLMTMQLSQPRTIVTLPDTDGARAPFFSPDGRWVGFWADAKVKKMPVDGGSPVELTDAVDFGGGVWGEDGDLIVSIAGALTRVSSTTGEATLLADLKPQGVGPWWPDVLPGGRHVLFTAIGPEGPDAASIDVLSLSDGTRRPLVRAASFGRYLADGFLVYVNQGTLFGVRFDAERLAVQGPGIPVLEDRVAYSTIFGNAKFDVSRNGRLIYRRTPPVVASWLDRAGGIAPLLTRPGAYRFPRLSPDGRRLAINVTDSGVLRTDLYDLRLGTSARLPFAPGNASPVWYPGGDSLVVGGRLGLWWMQPDDISTVAPLTGAPNLQVPWSFNADGTRLAYAEAAPDFNLWTVPVTLDDDGRLAAGEPELFLQTRYFETYPAFSPDGRWIAYGWGPQGIWDVYVRPFPADDSQEIKVSTHGGRIPRWLPNGRELVYRTEDHRLMVVGYEVKDGRFVAGPPTEWTPVRLGDTGVIANYDIDPSGDRILGLVPATGEEAVRIRNQVTLMPRFADEVARRLTPPSSNAR